MVKDAKKYITSKQLSILTSLFNEVISTWHHPFTKIQPSRDRGKSTGFILFRGDLFQQRHRWADFFQIFLPMLIFQIGGYCAPFGCFFMNFDYSKLAMGIFLELQKLMIKFAPKFLGWAELAKQKRNFSRSSVLKHIQMRKLCDGPRQNWMTSRWIFFATFHGEGVATFFWGWQAPVIFAYINYIGRSKSSAVFNDVKKVFPTKNPFGGLAWWEVKMLRVFLLFSDQRCITTWPQTV